MISPPPFGIVRDREEFTAVIRLYDNQGLNEKEKDWPSSVTIEEEGDGTLLFKVTTSGFYWLRRWVLPLGSSAEVLSPDWLKDEVKEEITKMTELYKEKETKAE